MFDISNNIRLLLIKQYFGLKQLSVAFFVII